MLLYYELFKLLADYTDNTCFSQIKFYIFSTQNEIYFLGNNIKKLYTLIYTRIYLLKKENKYKGKLYTSEK